MVNVLLHRCCAAQINSSRKSGRGAVMRPFIKQSIFTKQVYLDWKPSRRTRKINSWKNRKGYGKSETSYGKLLTRRIQICWVCFCVIHPWPLIFKTRENRVPTKLYQKELDSPRRIPVCWGLRPFWGASDQWKIDFLGISGSQAEFAWDRWYRVCVYQR